MIKKKVLSFYLIIYILIGSKITKFIGEMNAFFEKSPSNFLKPKERIKQNTENFNENLGFLI